MRRTWFATYAWAVLVYNLGVILWGAYVRATGSGAGCGSHWPLCNGAVLPRAARTETLIEFTHRLSSGLALLLVVALFVWALRAYGTGAPVWLGASLSLAFIIAEALIGAGLVLFELVADNSSVARALFIALHLANTFFLLAALTLTGWWASGGEPLRLRRQDPVAWLLGAGFLGMLIVGVSGAVTALGDTLFPASSLVEGLRQDLSPAAHFLIRLRVWHPVLAVVSAFGLVVIARSVTLRRLDPRVNWSAALVAGLTLSQLAAGALNVVLLAPVWLQLVHLLLADLIWIALVLLAAAALGQRAPNTAVHRLWEPAQQSQHPAEA
ncbi:MAG TPA: COX15/CtaA family protein [Ardenticatenaceae bacterium]|nr:COX15/CtaA family protein [Ardenticatenaceae bacterium]